jgi:transposase
MEYAYYAGIDVSLEKLTVVVLDAGQQVQAEGEFSNNPQGQRQVVRLLRRLKAGVHAGLEPTNVYHLGIALTLQAQPRIDVSVISSAAARHFAQALMQRAKTDRVDARTLAEYLRVCQPTPWQPPRPLALKLRSLTRHIAGLVKRQTALKCQQHSARRAHADPLVLQSINADLKIIKQRISKLRQHAVAMIKGDPQFARWYKLLNSVPGIASITATYLIGEYGVLPAGLSKKQWVALAGLDPVLRESGKSVNKPRHISKKGGKHTRRATFLSASVAVRNCAEMRAYCAKIEARTGSKLAALCAVMRKMLQAIWGMLHYDQPFNPARFCPNG